MDLVDANQSRSSYAVMHACTKAKCSPEVAATEFLERKGTGVTKLKRPMVGFRHDDATLQAANACHPGMDSVVRRRHLLEAAVRRPDPAWVRTLSTTTHADAHLAMRMLRSWEDVLPETVEGYQDERRADFVCLLALILSLAAAGGAFIRWRRAAL